MKKLIKIAIAIGLTFLSIASKGQLLSPLTIQISDAGGGNTQWSLYSSVPAHRVGPDEPTGNVDEQIIFPKSAFNFSYAQPFNYEFNGPLAAITDVTTGQSVNLRYLFYFVHLDTLEMNVTLNVSQGDLIEITSPSTALVNIPYSELNPAIITYSTSDGFYGSGITMEPVPEPTGICILGLGATVIFLSRFRSRLN